jgi:PHP family Zn ribbon phosphoesterase
MTRHVSADLHIHTALSPCGGEEMKPPAILLTAERKRIAVVGIVDHSTAGNARAFLEASAAFDVRVFVGLEIETAEGVHVLALFDNTEQTEDMDRAIAEHLPAMANRPDILGEQYLLNEWGDVTGHEPRLLITATDLSLERIAEMCRARGGMTIPAHIDRPANGLLPTLGFVPPDLRVEAFELSCRVTPSEARQRWPELAERPLLTSSDAHFLADIGSSVTRISIDLAEAKLNALEWGEALASELVAAGDR